MASHAPLLSGAGLLRLCGALFLADAVWGVFWRYNPLTQTALSKRGGAPNLPYANSRSPMMMVCQGLGFGTSEDGKTDWPGALAGLGIAAALAILLGRSAIALTLLVLVVSVGTRLFARQGREPAFSTALLCVGLPWALGATLSVAGDETSLFGSLGAAVALGVAFTLLAWSVLCVEQDDGRERVGLVWAGQIIVVATMIALGEPVALATVGGFLIVPCLWMARCPDSQCKVAEALKNSDVWWLAAMLTACLSVRF